MKNFYAFFDNFLQREKLIEKEKEILLVFVGLGLFKLINKTKPTKYWGAIELKSTNFQDFEH
jgi:hypothetical protein